MTSDSVCECVCLKKDCGYSVRGAGGEGLLCVCVCVRVYALHLCVQKGNSCVSACFLCSEVKIRQSRKGTRKQSILEDVAQST